MDMCIFLCTKFSNKQINDTTKLSKRVTLSNFSLTYHKSNSYILQRETVAQQFWTRDTHGYTPEYKHGKTHCRKFRRNESTGDQQTISIEMSMLFDCCFRTIFLGIFGWCGASSKTPVNFRFFERAIFITRQHKLFSHRKIHCKQCFYCCELTYNFWIHSGNRNQLTVLFLYCIVFGF